MRQVGIPVGDTRRACYMHGGVEPARHLIGAAVPVRADIGIGTAAGEQRLATVADMGVNWIGAGDVKGNAKASLGRSVDEKRHVNPEGRVCRRNDEQSE